MDVELSWTALGDLLCSTALHCLGQGVCRHQDWFNGNSTGIWECLDGKCQACWACQDDASSQSGRGVCCAIHHRAWLHLRRLQDYWFSQKAGGNQSYANSHGWGSSVVHWGLSVVLSHLGHPWC